jgi:hypothetical protein
MPRSFRALLPTKVRTCLGPRPVQADALMGVLCLSRAISVQGGPGFPGPSLLRFVRTTSGRPCGRRSRELTMHVQTGASRPLPTLLRFSTRTRPRNASADKGVLSE